MSAIINQITERTFVISHMFHARRDKVWQAWTERERLMQWFGPAGVTIPVAKMDFRPGGSFHYCMRTADGKTMWGRFAYREIVAPEKIVLVNSFSDANGGLTRHPFNPAWPLETLSTTTFADNGEYTRLTIEWTPLNATDEERGTFNSAHDGMRQGWSGTFGQLTGYLVKA
jgi:uncharacterized protein YndB with AHSA1/START domain